MGLGLGIGVWWPTRRAYSGLINCYIARVEAAGGTIESPSCIDSLGLNGYNWAYACRVTSAGGTIESLECATI